MTTVTEQNITETVIGSLGKNGEISDRQRELLTAGIKHIHGFIRDVKLQHSEFLWFCDYLARAGKLCSDKRQEFILLGDIIGAEVLVDMMTNPIKANETVSTVLGPFYRENPPVLPKGSSVIKKHFDDEETVYVEGHVRDLDGNPIAGVTIDIWEDAPNGLYENHDPDQPDYNLRGRLETDKDGHYACIAIRPVPYPIPEDATAGELLHAMGHHPNRPGHLHFLLAKDGYRTLITQVYDAESEWIDNDSVFAVKDSLIGKFEKAPAGSETDLVLHFDFVLNAAEGKMAAE